MPTPKRTSRGPPVSLHLRLQWPREFTRFLIRSFTPINPRSAAPRCTRRRQGTPPPRRFGRIDFGTFSRPRSSSSASPPTSERGASSRRASAARGWVGSIVAAARSDPPQPPTGERCVSVRTIGLGCARACVRACGCLLAYQVRDLHALLLAYPELGRLQNVQHVLSLRSDLDGNVSACRVRARMRLGVGRTARNPPWTRGGPP